MDKHETMITRTCREIPYIPYGKCSAILGITGSSTQLPDPVEHSFDLLLVVRDEVRSRRQMDAVLAENLNQFIAQRQSWFCSNCVSERSRMRDRACGCAHTSECWRTSASTCACAHECVRVLMPVITCAHASKCMCACE